MIAAKRWAVTILITMLRPASFQYPMPMYPGQIFAIPPPPPPIQVAVIPVMMTTKKPTTTTLTTTTETEQNIPIVMPVAVPYPIPVPMPAQIAVPAMPQPHFCMTTDPNRPKNCPPCPPCLCMPSCTPAFFSYCSPCHLQCRCRSREDNPVPQPPVAPFPMPGPAYPMPGPAFPMPMPVMPPAIILAPIPPGPAFTRRPVISETDTSDTEASSDSSDTSNSCSGSSSSSSSSTTSSENKRRGKRKWKRTRRGKSRKNWKKLSRKRLRVARRGFGKKYELVRPVLSYMSKNGEVKVHKRLSEHDAKALLKNDVKDKLKRHGFEVKYNVESKPYRSKDSKKRPSGDTWDTENIVLRRSGLDHVLEKGSNEFSFRPSGHGKISNVSLNFNVS